MKILILALFVISAFAQDAPVEKPADSTRIVTRVIEFILDDGEKMQKLAGMFAHRVHRINVEPSVGLVVITGREQDVIEVERAILRFYKPKPLEAGISGPANRNFELVLQVLYAKAEGSENSVPAGMQAVVQQLKQVTNLTSFRSIESQVIRIRNGEKVQTLGMLQWPDTPDRSTATYQFQATVKIKGLVIQCDELRYVARIPYVTAPEQYAFRDINIFTAVDLKPGQATVIGKANASAKDGAIVLVLTARLVD